MLYVCYKHPKFLQYPKKLATLWSKVPKLVSRVLLYLSMIECVSTVKVTELRDRVEEDRRMRIATNLFFCFFFQMSPTIPSSLLQCIYSHMAQLSNVVGGAWVNQPITPFFITRQDTNHINTYSE